MDRGYLKQATESARKNFAQNLRYYMNEKKIKQQMLAQEINVNQTTISSWLNLDSEPSVSKVLILAEFFSCSIEDLLK